MWHRKYINIKSAFPTEEIYDISKNKLEGIFRKIEEGIPYVEGYDDGEIRWSR